MGSPSPARPVENPLYHGRAINWPTVAILLADHGLALSAIFQPFRIQFLPLMVLIYAWVGFSTTAYLHRYLSHRICEAHPAVRLLGWLGAVVGLQGDPVGWVAHHRYHHAHSDQPNDVHTPRHGWWYAYAGWIIRIRGLKGTPLEGLSRDVLAEGAYVRWIHAHPPSVMLPHLLMAGLFYGTLGFAGMVWCLYFPIVAVHTGAWLVNSLGHTPGVGTRAHDTRDWSRNVAWLALPTLGDAYHNNHHAAPALAAHGRTWREPDATAVLLRLLERVGLVKHVRWAIGAAESKPAA